MADSHRRSASAPTPEASPNLAPARSPSNTPPLGTPRMRSPLRAEVTPEVAVADLDNDTAPAEPVVRSNSSQQVNISGPVPRRRKVIPPIPVDNNETDPVAFQSAFQKRHHQRSWHTSTLEWKGKLTEEDCKNGRVLIMDYIHSESNKKVAIAHQEIFDIHKLVNYYADSKRCNQATVRVVHVQNAPWATKFLMKRYNIDSRDDLVGTDFARWARFEKPEWRAGKPLLKGRTWRPQRDPWRAIRRTAFGVDYLKPYDVRNVDRPWQDENGQLAAKMMELQCYDDQDGATYGYDVFVQRTSVYIQYSDGDESHPPEDIRNPYMQLPSGGIDGSGPVSKEDCEPLLNGHKPKSRLPPLNSLDNGNAIIIFEHSQTESVNDTLIGARQEIESRWRRLTFFLSKDIIDKERLGIECMNAILEDVFKALSSNWDNFLTVAETHVSILEDKIYDSPADETRAPELWSNSNAWLKVEKLIAIHSDVVKETINRLQDVIEVNDEQDEWLDGIPDEFQKISNLVQEDLVKPTTVLGDLMYKSVGIRDSRHSLQLGTSMWRLSWITFIFLPLTFIVGFFGMNVDTFEDNPSIKYYFIAAVPFMVAILVCWYVLKHIFARRRQTPYQRGVYEHLFHDLAVQHPEHWTRGGPREDVRPATAWGRLRWHLLKVWFDPERTIKLRSGDPDVDQGGSGLGAWARAKRTLARRWLGTIRLSERTASQLELGQMSSRTSSVYNVASGLQNATVVAVTEAEPSVHPVTRANLSKLAPPPQSLSSRRASSTGVVSIRPTSSSGSSGYVVEEQEIPDSDNPDSSRWMFDEGVRRSIDGTLMETLNRARP